MKRTWVITAKHLRITGIVICLLVFFVTQSGGVVTALTGNDINSIIKKEPLFDYLEQGCGFGENEAGASDPALVGTQNEEIAFNYLVARQLSPAQAAGIVGNLKAESGVNPRRIQGTTPAENERIANPQPTPNVGYGIAQWTPAGRQQGLINLAREKGKEPYDLEVQLLYLWHELEGPYRQRVLEPLRRVAGNDDAAVRAASDIILHDFESPRDQGPTVQEFRASLGRQILAQFGGGSTSTPTPISGYSCNENTGDGSVVTVDGFTFPLQTTKYAIMNNKGALWCYKKVTNCHHDYNAADIHVPTGTLVVAARPGEVVQVGSGPVNTVIKDSEQPYIYYYTHMLAGSAKISRGETVAGGQPLGNVGLSSDAAGTNPHLHIDMLPSPPYATRMGCAGRRCSGFPFVNIQAILNKAYEALPER